MSSYRRSQQRYVATLALFAGGILMVGYYLKPSEVPEPTISQAETSRLQRISQRANLEGLSGYFTEIANEFGASAVWITETGNAGLIWRADGTVVAPATPIALPEELEITALTVGGAIPLRRVNDSAPIATVYQAPLTFGLQTPGRIATGAVRPGSWIVQIGRRASGALWHTQGTYGGSSEVVCDGETYMQTLTSLPLQESSLGSGIFDLDGDLLAMVVRCEGRLTALTPQSIDTAITNQATVNSRLRRAYGFTVEPLNPVATTYFDAASGVWVDSVQGATALAPGDVITALGNRPIAEPDDLETLFGSNQRPVAVEVLRSGRTVVIELARRAPNPSPQLATPNPLGIGLESAAASGSSGFAIDGILPDSPAARAGLRTGDRLLSIDGQAPANTVAATQTLSAINGGVAFLVIERGQERRGVFLP